MYVSTLFILERTHVVCLNERNVLFYDTLDIFYLRLYSVRQMVKDHSDSERGNPRPPLHGLFFSISSKESFVCQVNGAVPKCLRPIMAETDCDVVHSPTLGNKHSMFEPWLADVVNQFAYFPIWWHQGCYPDKHRLYVLGR